MRAAFLAGVDLFDAPFFGISPREAVGMDPQHRLLLEVSHEALEDACLARGGSEDDRTGVFVGLTTSEYSHLVMGGRLDRIDPYYVTGNSLNAAAGRLSYVLGLAWPEPGSRHCVLVVAGRGAPGVPEPASTANATGAGRRREPDPLARSG